jgi:hypothetical protein
MHYACSSYLNGGPGSCSNSARLHREKAEEGVLAGVRRQYLDPAVLEEAKRRARSHSGAHGRAGAVASSAHEGAAGADREPCRCHRAGRAARIARARHEAPVGGRQQPAARQSAKIFTMLPAPPKPAGGKSLAGSMAMSARRSRRARCCGSCSAGRCAWYHSKVGASTRGGTCTPQRCCGVQGLNGSGGLITDPATLLRLSLAA